MIQDYDSTHIDTYPSSDNTVILPSEQTLQNILGFVRCCQTIDADGVKMRLFLN